jgi:hypothetical protein
MQKKANDNKMMLLIIIILGHCRCVHFDRWHFFTLTFGYENVFKKILIIFIIEDCQTYLNLIVIIKKNKKNFKQNMFFFPSRSWPVPIVDNPSN